MILLTAAQVALSRADARAVNLLAADMERHDRAAARYRDAAARAGNPVAREYLSRLADRHGAKAIEACRNAAYIDEHGTGDWADRSIASVDWSTT